METRTIAGLHHVTAIAGDPQRNLAFYRDMLGLRLVKITVNYDDPGSYHLYYGDAIGRPGTILTFFAWPGAPRGRLGVGQIAATGFAIPQASLGFWVERLTTHNIAYEGPTKRFDETVLSFKDPDGMPIELVAHPRATERAEWESGRVPPEHAIRGLHSVTLWEDRVKPTTKLLTETLGFHEVASEGQTTRYAIGDGGPGTLVDVREAQGFWHGSVAVGSFHHVAWRTPDDPEQVAWRSLLIGEGHQVSPVMDRQYFHSIYFREPGGVLFEIATDPPGFTADETVENLGTSLRLPSWLEPQRAIIEESLPALRLEAGEGYEDESI